MATETLSKVYIGLAGSIGAGKTTVGQVLVNLLNGNGQDAIFLEEEIPEWLLASLRNSNADPVRHMEVFQTLMVMRAVVRRTRSWKHKLTSVVINERPLEESWVFGKANLALGRISQQFYDEIYSKIFEEYTFDLEDIIVFLYVNEETAAIRREKRCRPGEDIYGEQYLTAIADEYFKWVTSCCASGRMLVVDWNTPLPPEQLLKRISDALKDKEKLLIPSAPHREIADPLERRRYQESRLTEIARQHAE